MFVYTYIVEQWLGRGCETRRQQQQFNLNLSFTRDRSDRSAPYTKYTIDIQNMESKRQINGCILFEKLQRGSLWSAKSVRAETQLNVSDDHLGIQNYVHILRNRERSLSSVIARVRYVLASSWHFNSRLFSNLVPI